MQIRTAKVVYIASGINEIIITYLVRRIFLWVEKYQCGSASLPSSP